MLPSIPSAQAANQITATIARMHIGTAEARTQESIDNMKERAKLRGIFLLDLIIIGRIDP